MDNIQTPNGNDVLCGRGRAIMNHQGNKNFRALIQKYNLDWVKRFSSLKNKREIVQRIVNDVKNQSPPGRFLKKDRKTDIWHDIGHNQSLEKTRQALRDEAKKYNDAENCLVPDDSSFETVTNDSFELKVSIFFVCGIKINNILCTHVFIYFSILRI